MTKRGMAATLPSWSIAAALVGAMMVGCGDDAVALGDAGPGVDLGPRVDLGSPDLGPDDLGSSDLGSPDFGPPSDAGPRCAPEPSGDTRWAQYPMPGTPGHPRRYQVTGAAGAGTVIDCVTGLEWQRAAAPGTYTQAAALAYCDGLTLAGYTDWRLPSRIELVTLVDYAVASPGPMIDGTAFPGTPAVFFWSASSIAGSPPYAWNVDFHYGTADGYRVPTLDGGARCVRGNDTVSVTTGPPPGHFTDLGDGTVRDNATGLVWQQGFSPSTQEQGASIAYCSTLTAPSGGGWRLPTIAELQTLVDETVALPSIDTGYFPSTPTESFWASSSLAGWPDYAWSVFFAYGYAVDNGATAADRARCVR
jgi:hypothetical protein